MIFWKVSVLPHFRCSSRPGDQGKALRCLALPTSRTAPVSNRQQARNRPRISFSLNGITALVLLHLHRKCGRTKVLAGREEDGRRGPVGDVEVVGLVAA